MKPDEAIKDLKALKDFFEEQSGGSYPICLEHAIFALEKQVPKTVRTEHDRRHSFYLHFCPVCGGLAREYKYCSDCGQALSYEEETDETE